MKTICFTLLLAGSVFAAMGQQESDDLYFTAADRQREISARPRTTRVLDGTYEEAQVSRQAAFDGYFTGRSVNPDYDPSVSTTVTDYSYFDSNYNSAASMMSSYNSYRQGNYPNSAFGNGWNNPMSYGYGYGAGRYGYNPFYNPYNSFGYGGFNSPWNNFGYGMNPYYGGMRSGWTITTMYGNGGWYGMNPYMGYNNFYSYNSFGGGFYPGLNSFYNPYGNYATGYDNRPKLTYGKRPSRSSDFDNDAREPVRRYTIQSSGNAPRSAGGRSSAQTNNTYYQRGWRQDPSINPRIPSDGSNGYTGGRSSSWSQHQNSWGSSDFGGRSSGFSSGGRSSGFSGGGSSHGSSGGRRGRD